MKPSETELRAALNQPERLRELLINLSKLIANHRGWEFPEKDFVEIANMVLPKAYKLKPENKAFNYFSMIISCCLIQFRRRQKTCEV